MTFGFGVSPAGYITVNSFSGPFTFTRTIKIVYGDTNTHRHSMACGGKSQGMDVGITGLEGLNVHVCENRPGIESDDKVHNGWMFHLDLDGGFVLEIFMLPD